MQDNTKKPIATYTAEEVFAASIAATRVNKGYLKKNELQEGEVANSTLMLMLLSDQSFITDEDRAKVDDVRKFWQGLIFTATSRTLSPFEQNMLDASNATEVFSGDKQLIGLISYMPHGYEKGRKRRDTEELLRMSNNELLGNTGDKVQLSIKILKTSGPYFNDIPGSGGKFLHVGLSDKNQAIRFYYKEKLDDTVSHNIFAKVKNVRDDGSTQLNYVQVL